MFEPNYVYTFNLWQHTINISTYTLSVVRQFPLLRHLDGQPLQVMAKNEETGQYPWSFELWHQGLLADAHRCDLPSSFFYIEKIHCSMVFFVWFFFGGLLVPLAL